MILKALIVKKLAAVAALSAMALTDGIMTNRSYARGAKELNPFVRPFVGKPSLYAATQFDVVLAGVLMFARPQSVITKGVFAEAAASHGWGVVTNIRYKPVNTLSSTLVCAHFGPHGADESCQYQVHASR